MPLPTPFRWLCAMCAVTTLHAQSAERAERFRMGAEVQTRYELLRGGAMTESGDGYLMTRVRVQGLWRPAANLTVLWEVQDARLKAAQHVDYAETFTNRADLRAAAVEWSSRESKRWRVTVGRQQFSLGEERLIGSDSEWCNLSRSFDGVRTAVGDGSWQLEAFHFHVVEPVPSHPDRPFHGPRLAGVSASYESEAGGWSVEPYGVYATALGLSTSGGLVEVRLGSRLKGWSEMAIQTGRSTRAWAGAWGADLQLTPGETANAVLGASYSRASGDSHPSDGLNATFNDLYSADYNSCGMLDPFAWRNLGDAAISFAWPVTPRFSFQVENHAYWLAAAGDSLHALSGAVTRLPPSARSSYLGDQINVGAIFRLAGEFTLFVGGGRLAASDSLRQAGMSGTTTVADRKSVV